MILVSEVEAIRDKTQPLNTRCTRANAKTQNGGDENQNLHGRDGPFPYADGRRTDNEKQNDRNKTKLYLSGLPSLPTYFLLKNGARRDGGLKEAIKKETVRKEDSNLKWITFKHDSRAKSIKRVNFRLSSFSRTPRGCSDST